MTLGNSFPEGRRPGDGELAAVRSNDDTSWVMERWRDQHSPHRPGRYLWMAQANSQTMSELSDAGFLVSMGNRLKALESDHGGPLIWQRIKGFIFGANKIPLAGFEIRRLKSIAGEASPDALQDDRIVNVSYGLFKRMLGDVERAAARAARSDRKSGSVN